MIDFFNSIPDVLFLKISYTYQVPFCTKMMFFDTLMNIISTSIIFTSKMMKINLYFDVIWVPLYLWQPILTHMWFHSSNFRRIDYLISRNKQGYHYIKQNMIHYGISFQSFYLSNSKNSIYESYCAKIYVCIAWFKLI